MKGISKIISASIILMRLGSSRADPCVNNQFNQMPVIMPSQVLIPGNPNNGLYNCSGNTPQVFYPTTNGVPTAPGTTTPPTRCEVSVVKNCEGAEETPNEPETVITTPPPVTTTLPSEVITVQTVAPPALSTPPPSTQTPTVVGVPVVGPNGEQGVVGMPAVMDCSYHLTPGVPVAPGMPGVPLTPCNNITGGNNVPVTPTVPITPSAPVMPGVPTVPITPSVPVVPGAPTVPITPGVPAVPGAPVITIPANYCNALTGGIPVNTLPGAPITLCNNITGGNNVPVTPGMPITPGMPVTTLPGAPITPGMPVTTLPGAPITPCNSMSVTTLPNPSIGNNSYFSESELLGIGMSCVNLGEVGKTGVAGNLGANGCPYNVSPSTNVNVPGIGPQVSIGSCGLKTPRIIINDQEFPASPAFVQQMKDCPVSSLCGENSSCGMEASGCQSSCQATTGCSSSQ
ncbi:polar tube protein 1 [Ordospora colligata OC4]|uniref:Polar tube protein 1 n=1 Tax=Ordospora colligata OC4 TaxID=1354746 RepID=A0A0B2UJJ8_9MICR|nr:polar tube protein 1 [Ordospora colligata OC4]KHN69528.1 polar tube protein 1 [Ordospora colligata OC4]